ncbi:MAG TPA: metallophosphoesterase [Planctomycetota bacterium]
MKRRLAWVGAILGGLATAFLGLLLGIRAFTPDVPWPPAAWSPPQGPYKVAVLGDLQKGITNGKNLVEEVRKAGVTLTLQSGDLVSENDDGHYRLAARTVRNLPGSFRTVPGNHDIKGTPERFLKAFGALEFELPGPVTFLGLNSAFGEPIDIARLEARTAGKEAVVLLFHVPTSDPAFLAWLDKSPRVKYVFNGHRHAYSETKVGSTTVVVNGIGGDYDSWQFDQKACAVILDIDGTSIRHSTITLPAAHGLGDNLEHAALGHLGPWAWPAGLGLLALTVSCIQIIKNKKAAPSPLIRDS